MSLPSLTAIDLRQFLPDGYVGGISLAHGELSSHLVRGNPAAGAAVLSNLHCLPVLRDFAVTELGIAGTRCPIASWGRAGDDGNIYLSGERDLLLSAIWQHLLMEFGPLPWRHVEIAIGEHTYPKGLSLPGMIVLSRGLLLMPSTARYLYLVHELVHQWVGNLLTVPAEGVVEREALADALAWAAVARVAGEATNASFARLIRSYASATDGGLANHGRRVLSLHNALGRAPTRAALANLIDDSRINVARYGRRLIAQWVPGETIQFASAEGQRRGAGVD